MKYNYEAFVISAKRPQNVKLYKDIEAIWVVPEGEGEAYYAAGARVVIEAGKYPNLIIARNTALDYCQEHKIDYCIQMDDDIERVFTNSNHEAYRKTSIAEVIPYYLECAEASGIRLIGPPPTDNPFFAKEEFKENCFLIGNFFLCKVSHLRFDPEFRVKEDYDFTMQHIKEFGSVLRLNRYLMQFKHYKNPGGVVDYRTLELEQEACQRLVEKWGDWIKPHGRREGEVVLKTPRLKKQKV